MKGAAGLAGDRRDSSLISLRVAGLYLLVSVLWIPLSDAVVNRIAGDRDDLNRLQTIKGWGFLILTSLLLFVLIRQALRRSTEEAGRSRRANAQLELVLSQVPGILMTTDRDLRMTSSRGSGLAKMGLEPDASNGELLSHRLADSGDRERLLEAARQALEGRGSSFVTELRGRWLESTVVPLQDVAGQPSGILGLVQDVTEQREMLKALEASAQERTRLLKHLVNAEKEERERIASGIHDDSLQVITSAGMALDLLQKDLESQRQLELAARARGYLSDAIHKLRALVFELKPVELDEEGLAAGLRQVLERASEDAGFSYEIDDKIISGLSSASRYSVFRIAQEAIMNARKHSEATKLVVRISEVEEGIGVVISDDGSGFDMTQQRQGHHFGLREMRQRAELAGGWCKVSSAPGQGTNVELWMPLIPPDAVEQRVRAPAP